MSVTEEWDANDYGLHAASDYIRTHPANTLRADLRKASVFFLAIRRNGGDEVYSPAIEAAFNAGLILFRLMLLAAIVISVRQLFTPRGERFEATVFLGTVICVALPYVAGFALTRHAFVLILPTALCLCRFVFVGHAPVAHAKTFTHL